MKTIIGLTISFVAWFGLLVGILVLGFQSQSLADVFMLSGTFGNFEAMHEIMFTFLVPLVLVLVLGGTAIGVFTRFKEAE